MQNLSESIETFLKHCAHERHFSTHTIKAYRLDLTQFSRFTTERHSSDALSLVTRAHLREFTESLTAYKPRTQRRKLAALKSLFGFLEREELIVSNPVRALRLDIRVGRALPRTIGLTTLRGLFDEIYERSNQPVRRGRRSLRAIRDIALFELMFASGMRVSEVSHLLVGSVDLLRGTVMVLGKGNKERQIPLCDREVQAALAAYLASQSAQRPPKDYFFTNRFGRRLSEQSIRMALRRHAKAAGLQRITPHVFRHTVATMLLEQGVDLRFIQNFLGHSSIVTTTIYAHVNDKAQRAILTERHPRRLLGALGREKSKPICEG
jgi:integrase/recombinase XerD